MVRSSSRPWRWLSAVATGGLLAVASAWSCGGANESDAAPGSRKIRDYCNEILPVMCEYAITTKGCFANSTQTVTTCERDALPSCCQGTCDRPALTATPYSIASCLHAYTGAPASAYSAISQVPSASPSDAGLACDAIVFGTTPQECANILVLQ